MQVAFVILFFSLLIIELGKCDSGKEIVQKLYEHRNKCNEPYGSNWVPLPEGLKCGARSCDFPKEWCAIRSKQGVPDLYCVSLDSTCQESLKEGVKESAGSKIISSASTSADDEEDEVVTTRKPTKATTANVKSSEESEISASTKGSTSKIAIAPCEDFHDVCCFWAASGECDRNPGWMKRTCRKSCGVCNCSPDTADQCPTQVNLDNCRWLGPFPTAPLPNGRPGPGPPATPLDNGKTRILLPVAPPTVVAPTVPPPNTDARPQPVSVAGCQDRQPLCRFWSSTGQCGINRVFMAVNCPVSCGLCSRFL